MQLRRDPISGSQVLIAGRRSGCPNDFVVTARPRVRTKCPFCRGSERETPAPLMAYHAVAAPPGENQGGAEWQVRVVPNKYPAVWSESAAGGSPWLDDGEGVVRGRHEVIIESPRHVTRLTELTDDELRLTFRAYRDRIQAASRQAGLAYAQVYKNSGSAAGASLEHVHSQLLALPVVPPRVQDELGHCREHWRVAGECLVCREIALQRSDGRQIVAETGELVAWCPPASRFPYEVWVAPRVHASRYEQAEDLLIDSLARLIRSLVAGLEQCLADLAYNYYLHTTPFPAAGCFDRHEPDYYHWHWELTPRVTRPGGFEWASGMWINPVVPEEAAEHLRARLGS